MVERENKSMIAPIENDMINGMVRRVSDGSASCEKMPIRSAWQDER